MTLRLVSFAGCPYVHRAVIVLHEKGVDYTVEEIDLSNKPDWFLAISPRGKVPLLDVDGEILFESAAIVEYLEDSLPGRSMRSEDLIERSRERAHVGFVTEELYSPMYGALLARDPEKRGSHLARITAALAVLEDGLEGREWLSNDGTSFGLADLAAAPVICRLEVMHDLGIFDWPAGARLSAWKDRLLTRQSVRAGFPPVAADTIRGYLA